MMLIVDMNGVAVDAFGGGGGGDDVSKLRIDRVRG